MPNPYMPSAVRRMGCNITFIFSTGIACMEVMEKAGNLPSTSKYELALRFGEIHKFVRLNKLKIYLDTSIINFLFADDVSI